MSASKWTPSSTRLDRAKSFDDATVTNRLSLPQRVEIQILKSRS